jgi:hypothetical protein
MFWYTAYCSRHPPPLVPPPTARWSGECRRGLEFLKASGSQSPIHTRTCPNMFKNVQFNIVCIQTMREKRDASHSLCRLALFSFRVCMHTCLGVCTFLHACRPGPPCQLKSGQTSIFPVRSFQGLRFLGWHGHLALLPPTIEREHTAARYPIVPPHAQGLRCRAALPIPFRPPRPFPALYIGSLSTSRFMIIKGPQI